MIVTYAKHNADHVYINDKRVDKMSNKYLEANNLTVIHRNMLPENEYQEEIKNFNERRKTFSDVETYHKNNDAIAFLKDKKILQGYNDGSFKPDATINRAEFMKIVIAQDIDPSVETYNHCFPDVQRQWFAPYICYAKEQGLIKGYQDGTFKPEQNISFVEAAKIIAQAEDKNIQPGKVWYENYVKKLESGNAIPSEIETLEHPISRGQMSEIMYRIKGKINYKSSRKLKDF